MTVVKMPQLGETVIEGTILKWLKQEGDQVALDEPLFEISTDKVDTEVPSSAAGVLAKIMVPEGETVAVGTELAEIADGGAGAAEAPGAAAQLASDGSSEAETSSATAGGADAPSAPAPPAAAPAPPPALPRRWPLRRRRSRRRLRIGGLVARSCRRSFGSWRRSTAWISRR